MNARPDHGSFGPSLRSGLHQPEADEAVTGPEWLPDEEVRRLRRYFLQRARTSRRLHPPMFGPLLRIASEYGAFDRARRNA